jgi:hypothetical protein
MFRISFIPSVLLHFDQFFPFPFPLFPSPYVCYSPECNLE